MEASQKKLHGSFQRASRRRLLKEITYNCMYYLFSSAQNPTTALIIHIYTQMFINIYYTITKFLKL